MKIGKRIFELRKKNKLSQEELAEKINVSRQTISNWETDQTVPDIYQAKELSKVLNISIDELVRKENTINTKKEEEKLIEPSLIWKNIKSYIREAISEVGYEIWFKDITKVKIKNEEFILYVDTELTCMHINNYYIENILKLINDYYSKEIKKITIVVDKKTNKY